MRTKMKCVLSCLMALVLMMGLFSPVGVVAREVPTMEEADEAGEMFWEWLQEQSPGVLILEEREFFTQDELREMLVPLEVRELWWKWLEAPFPESAGWLLSQRPLEHWFDRFPQTIHPTLHPERAMTQRELATWIAEYRELGGISAFELEVVYLLNEIRLEHGLTPYTICPNLSMSARLSSQLSNQFRLRSLDSPWVVLLPSGRIANHEDPFYGGPTHRIRLFIPNLPSANSFAGENTSFGSTPARVVDGWMNSTAHRNAILTNRRHFIGIGRHGAGAVQMHFSGF